jgi:hypothetical protein
MSKIDQLPAELHVTIYQGDAWRIAVDFNMDLTGYTIAANVHPNDGSSDVPMAIEETNLADGQFDIVLTTAQSADLGAAYHSWCLVMSPAVVNPDPTEPRTHLAGRFIVRSCT